MAIASISPTTGETLATFAEWTPEATRAALDHAGAAWPAWRATPLDQRIAMLRRAAEILRRDAASLARIMADEMGKPVTLGQGEAVKCAAVCDYYADNAAAFLAPVQLPSDAASSYVAYEPLGVILAVMPWNFPLWQVFRIAAPALAAGNGMVLKHASNVPQCALAIEAVLREAGLPEHVFRTLLIGARQVESVIAHPAVAGVSLTGSGPAGAQVAAAAGRHLKRSLLELGGSDPFVVLADADLEAAASVAVTARFANSGQTCIAAKRFIVEDAVHDAFVELFAAKAAALVMGNPHDPATQLGPLARPAFVAELDALVSASVQAGATVALAGGPVSDGGGAFYRPVILTGVTPGMAVFDEETFGPVAAVTRARDADHAVELANATLYGLGGSVWTRDAARGEAAARRIDAGAVFVNGQVKSDPRLPFGGIKASGYGRELWACGMHEFMNVKTVWIG